MRSPKYNTLNINNLKLAVDYIGAFRRFHSDTEVYVHEIFTDFCKQNGLHTIKGKNLFLTVLVLMGFERKVKTILEPKRTTTYVYKFNPNRSYL
jgi:hypothetical protein